MIPRADFGGHTPPGHWPTLTAGCVAGTAVGAEDAVGQVEQVGDGQPNAARMRSRKRPAWASLASMTMATRAAAKMDRRFTVDS